MYAAGTEHLGERRVGILVAHVLANIMETATRQGSEFMIVGLAVAGHLGGQDQIKRVLKPHHDGMIGVKIRIVHHHHVDTGHLVCQPQPSQSVLQQLEF